MFFNFILYIIALFYYLYMCHGYECIKINNNVCKDNKRIGIPNTPSGFLLNNNYNKH